MSLTEEIAIAIERLGHLMRQLEWEHVAGSGLSPLQRQILWFIHTYPGRARAVYIGRYLGVKKPTISLALKHLEEKGLIQRQTDPKNRRSHVLSLSESGRLLASYLTLKSLHGWIEVLPDPDKAKLKEALYLLLSHLHRAGALQEIYLCETCGRFLPEKGFCSLAASELSPAERRISCEHHTWLKKT